MFVRAQSCPTPSVHGILWARLLEWIAISSSRRSSWFRNWTHVSCVGKRLLYHLSHLESPTAYDCISGVQWACVPRLWPSRELIFTHPQLCCCQSLSHVQLFATLWIAACEASLSFTFSESLLKLLFFESVMPPSHRILCRSLLLLPLVFPSIRVFFGESALCIR